MDLVQERLEKCYLSARLRILKAEDNPPEDWFTWWDMEIKRQTECTDVALRRAKKKSCRVIRQGLSYDRGRVE